MLFWSAQTMINVPHAALAGELVEQQDERNAIMGWREAMQQLGLLVGASAPLLVLRSMQDATLDRALASGLSEQAWRAVSFAARGEAHGVMAWQLASLAIAASVCGFLFLRFPITRAIHESSLEELASRR